jgi:hypothetical protein
MAQNARCEICGEDKYPSAVCANCDKIVCEDCEIRYNHDGVIDVVCPHCNYLFGSSLVIDDSKNSFDT